jgi:tetratricopeptide (TPR) repeat protein
MTKQMHSLLFSLALTSERNRIGRAEGLAMFAEACAEAGEEEACDEALSEAVRLLELAASADDERFEVATCAREVATIAESLKRTGVVRAALAVAVALLDPDEHQGDLGVVWHNIGIAWARDGDDAQALQSLRRAAEHDAHGASLDSRLITLMALARTAESCGARGDRDKALTTGVELLAATGPGGAGDRDETAVLGNKLGRCAEALQRPDLARHAYMVVIEAADDMRVLATAWSAIGNTWRTEGEAEQALESHRTAVRLLPAIAPLGQRLTMLDRLAQAEREGGTRAACNAALAEGLRGLQAAAEEHPDEVKVSAKAWGDLAASLKRWHIALASYRLAEVPRRALPGRLLLRTGDDGGENG